MAINNNTGMQGTQGKEHFLEKDEERRIPLMREELRIGKREVARGGVHVSVRVKETPVTERISLREEHVEIERRPVDRLPNGEEIMFKDWELDLQEYGEEPIVSKEVRVVEEVILNKHVTDHDEVVQGTVRSTELDVAKSDGGLRRSGEGYLASGENFSTGGTYDAAKSSAGGMKEKLTDKISDKLSDAADFIGGKKR